MKRTDVLLALGSPALLKVMEEALLREGLSVTTTGNGVDAVMEAVRNRPRCVLCGEILAGMDGMKVCRLLNSIFSRREVPVILSIPDSKPEMRQRALNAGASAVVDYSTPHGEVSDLVRLHLSEIRSVPGSAGLALSRERIPSLAADVLEETLESMEAVLRLARELRGVSSIAEACRKTSAAVLWGLGFQRVWIGLVNRSRTAIDAVAYRGRGVTGDPVALESGGRKTTADMAVSSGVQVSSWEWDFADPSLKWAGSSIYVDTPVRSGGDVTGIIRCDNGLSRRKPSSTSLRCLRFFSDILSSFLRYLDARNVLEERTASLDSVLVDLKSVTLVLDSQGRITGYMGDFSQVPGVSRPSRGADLKSILSAFPERITARLNESLQNRRDTDTGPVPVEDGRFSTALSLRTSPGRESVLTLSDMTLMEKLSERNRNLEFETDAMASLAADLSAEGDAREICRTVARTLESFYREESIAVLSACSSRSALVPDSLEVHAVAGSDYQRGGLIPGSTIQVGAPGGGVVSEAVRSGRIVNVPDVLNGDFYVSGISSTRSEISIPMQSRGRIVGLIDIQSSVRSRFHGDDIRRLRNLVGFAAGALDAALQKTELINMARRDRLTGIHNMTFFEERYPEEFERAQRYSYPFSLIMMDIDDFKNYNDSWGHPMGNVLLRRVTEAMGDTLRDVDMLIRYGGEEFICILPLTGKDIAVEIAERIRTAVMERGKELPHSEEQPGGCVSLSLGVATFPVDSRERNELIELADQRMYRAKRAGKNRVCHT